MNTSNSQVGTNHADPETSSPDVRRNAARSNWVIWVILGGVLSAICLCTGGRHAIHWWRSRQSGEFLAAAESLIKQQEWPEAARMLGEASRIAPEDPTVVRAIADFQIRTRSSPSNVAQTLQRLSTTGDANTQDLIKLARAQIDLGSHDAARKTLALVPQAVRTTSSQAIEAEAFMLKMERRDNEAEQLLRAALTHGEDVAKAAVRLAVLDFKQPHPEVHQRGRMSLWRIAQEHSDSAPDAIHLLAVDPNLTAVEAERLLEIAESLEDSNADLRYEVVAAVIRLHPDERQVILDRETTSAADNDEVGKLAFARFLLRVKEHERLLAYLSLKSTDKWKDLPANLLQLKMEALAQSQQWGVLSGVLNRDLEKVLGVVSFNLWQARTAAAQDPRGSLVEKYLKLAFEATDRGQNTRAAVQVAEAAERLDLRGLAASFYQSTATAAAAAQAQIAIFEKAYSLHAAAQDTPAMLHVAVEVSKRTPGNRSNAFRADYLALLVGESIEVVADRIIKTQAPTDPDSSAQFRLLKAMCAHRLHAPAQESTTLKALQSFPWTPGHRAVLAAMLAVSGEKAAGFQIAEKIPESLLLPEEHRLLILAK